MLREDLKISIPPIDEPLEQMEHPLLAKARDQFANDSGLHERIHAIDDEVLFKVKLQRWRGAVWIEDQMPGWWLRAHAKTVPRTTSTRPWRTRRPGLVPRTTEPILPRCQAVPMWRNYSPTRTIGYVINWRTPPASAPT